ncbi:hypothetical protein ANO11243_011680 [Dothideomycetidae sp. 11243]|nr:hypothetical protein ANO11243_011680 [fungal sp. No.11243]
MHAAALILSSALVVNTLALPQPLPAPQGIDFDLVDAAPTVVVQGAPLAAAETAAAPSYDAQAAAAAAAGDPITSLAARDVVKRAAPTCTSLPTGYGPVSNPDTAAAFQSNPVYAQTAQKAIVPDGYSLSFSSLTGATSASTYLGYYTLQSYNPVFCQQYCDEVVGCYGFNLYMERDPVIDPAASCPNPNSTTTIKCSLWGSQIDSTTATNAGQWRNQFQVLIAASNGYNSLAPPPAQANFTGPYKFGGAINSPDNSFIGSSVLSRNGVPQGTYCSMYTKVWGRPYDTNIGQYRGSVYYSVSQSYGYEYSVGADTGN